MKLFGNNFSIVVCKLIFFTILSVQTALGCMCGNTSASDAYQGADSIVVAEVINFKFAKIPEDTFIVNGNPNEFSSGQEVVLKVIKWFKGKSKTSTIKLLQPNSTCDWVFNNGELNQKFLFYLNYHQKYKAFNVISCGRSSRLSQANDDLSWLNKLPKSLNRTRLSGVVFLSNSDNDFPRLGGIRIEISGGNKKYELTTDKNGLYEIWDIPPGIYTISAEIPKDKKLSWTSSVPDNWIYFWSNDEQNYESLKVTLASKGTGGVDFALQNK